MTWPYLNYLILKSTRKNVYLKQQRFRYIALKVLTKAFDLASRDGLYRILEVIGCPPRIVGVIVIS